MESHRDRTGPEQMAARSLTEERGLEARYLVRKLNDPSGKHNECRYFVLDPQHDPIARQALAAYADDSGCPEALSRDLWAWLAEVTGVTP